LLDKKIGRWYYNFKVNFLSKDKNNSNLPLVQAGIKQIERRLKYGKK